MFEEKNYKVIGYGLRHYGMNDNQLIAVIDADVCFEDSLRPSSNGDKLKSTAHFIWLRKFTQELKSTLKLLGDHTLTGQFFAPHVKHNRSDKYLVPIYSRNELSYEAKWKLLHAFCSGRHKSHSLALLEIDLYSTN